MSIAATIRGTATMADFRNMAPPVITMAVLFTASRAISIGPARVVDVQSAEGPAAVIPAVVVRALTPAAVDRAVAIPVAVDPVVVIRVVVVPVVAVLEAVDPVAVVREVVAVARVAVVEVGRVAAADTARLTTLTAAQKRPPAWWAFPRSLVIANPG
jgi:hypothetical protein